LLLAHSTAFSASSSVSYLFLFKQDDLGFFFDTLGGFGLANAVDNATSLASYAPALAIVGNNAIIV